MQRFASVLGLVLVLGSLSAANARADAPANGTVLARGAYIPPDFSETGMRDTPEIREFYETEVLGELRAREQSISIERIDYASDGLRVRGFLLLPRTKSLEPLPLLIFNRGGNGDYGKIDPRTLSWLAHFAERGFAVAASQYRGNDGGEGADEFGGADVRDIFALRTAASASARLDPARTFVIGHSRGGMMTYLALRGNSEFLAAAVLAGECDIEEGLRDWPDFESVLAERIPNYESERESALERRSACRWAGEIRTPVLILQGDRDANVEPRQAEMAEAKLRAAGVEVKRVVYPGGHNLFFHPDYVPVIVEEILRFFAGRGERRD